MRIMRVIKTLIFFFLPVLSFGQGKEFEIFGTITGQYNSNNIYLFFENDIKHKDSSEIKDGKFYFKGIIPMPILGRINLGQGSLIPDFYIDGRKIYIDCATKWITYKSGNGGLDTMNLLKIINIRGSSLEDIKFNFEKWASSLKQSDKTEEEKKHEFYDKLSIIVTQHPNSKLSPYLISTASNLYYSQVQELSSLFDSSLKNTYEAKSVQRLLKQLDVSKNSAKGVLFHDAVLRDSSNKVADTKQFRGKYTVVVFWASWCGPCRAEHPELNALYEKYRGKGLELIGISIDDDRNKWVSAIKKDQLQWPQVSDLKGEYSEIANYYGLFNTGIGIPFNLLLDKDGKILEKQLTVGQLQRLLETLL